MNILSRLIYLFTAAEHGSVVSRVFSFVSGLEGNFMFQLIKNIALMIFNWILKLIWVIEKFVLGIMEALELVVNTFLGIGTTIDDILGFDTDLVSTLVKTFRAIFGVAIVLIIIFTIIAIIKQEYANVTSENGMSDENNKKGPIVKKLFIGIMSMILLPFVMIVLIGAVNSVLTAFNNALKGDQDTTIAGQVLATSTFDTNKYRIYAENNKRYPIVISAYDVDEFTADERERLYTKIKSTSVQKQLKNTAYNIGNDTVLSFNSALSYSNNKLTNNESYGDYYENFVCTAEQYAVFADFIDYCEISNVPFYIKSVEDEDIEWKYVDTSVFNPEELSLTITYRDANDLTANGRTDDTYTLTYSMGFDVTSPISNALDSISALLGLVKDENGNYFTFNEMEREEDSVNMVHWANEKASIHFSEYFDINDMNTWTTGDEILMYEYYHRSTNNTFADYRLEDLSYENRGDVTLDVYQIWYRDYIEEADAYTKERSIECVYINGSYYRVVKSLTEADGYGNSFYEFLQIDGADFLDDPYSVLSLEKDKTALLKFTGTNGKKFDINDPTSWSYTDQIIMYEYYSNLSYSNSLYQYDISQFSSNDAAQQVRVPVYKINDYNMTSGTQNATSTNTYALINGTYYLVTASQGGNTYSLRGVSNSRFLESVDGKSVFTTYSYRGSNNGDIVINDTYSRFGISTDENKKNRAEDFVVDINSDNYNDVENHLTYIFGEDEEAPDLLLSFNSGFDYRDTGTWSFKDYFLFYIFVKYLGNSGYTVESLKNSTLPGTIGKDTLTNEFYFKIAPRLTNGNNVYLKINEINNISNQNMREMIDAETTFGRNSFETQDELLFVTVTDPGTVFSRSETETRNFVFSDDANYESVSTWRMSDFLLFLLNSKEILSISTNSSSGLQDFSYESICYKLTNQTGGADVRSQRLYAFGTGNNKVYLNENYILGLDLNKDGEPDYENLDIWLNTGLISYISSVLAASDTNVLQNESSLLQGLLDSENLSGKVYALNPLIRALVYEYGLKIENASKVFEVFESISRFEYINSNPEFYSNMNNLATWTAFDFIQYVLNGRVTGNYAGYLVKGTDGKTRYLIDAAGGSYAVSIDSGSFFNSSIAEKGTLTSSSVSLEGKSLSEYFEENLKDNVLEVLSSENNLYRYNSIDYSYSSNPSAPTKFDSIIAGLGFASASSYKLYSDGSLQYLYLGSKNGYDYFVQAVQIGYEPIATISDTVQITPNNSNIFIQEGSYTSFNTATNTFSALDALIAQLTGNTTKESYSIYKLSGPYGGNHNYIYVGGTFIEMTSGFSNYTLDALTQKLSGESGTNSSMEACIDMLMRNYYLSYIVESIPETVSMQSFTYDFSSFNLNNVSTWTPINLILFKEGAMDVQGNKVVSGTYRKTAGGDRYVEFRVVLSSGKVKSLKLNVSNLFNDDSRLDFTDSSKSLNASDESAEEITKLRYRVAMSKAQRLSSNEVTYLSPSEVVNSYATLKTVISAIYEKDITDSYTNAPIDQNLYMAETDLNSWNWLDVVYQYFFGSERTTNQFVYYTDASGKTYIGLNNGSRQIFVNFNDKMLSSSGQISSFGSGSERVSFSLSSASNSLIGLLYYKYTGVASGSVKYVEFTTTGNNVRVYAINDYANDTIVYVYYQGSSAVNFNSSNSTYLYETEATKDNLNNWTVFDLLIKAAIGNTTNKSATVSSKIYNFGEHDYLLINNYYIDLTLVKAGLTIPTDSSSADEELNITLKNNNQGGSMLVSDLLFDSTRTGSNKIVLTLSDGEVSTLTKESKVNDDDKPADGDIKLYFSDGFDFSDYSTWTVSDFVLYYLFTSEQMDASIKNFQYYVNLGYVPASVYYLQITDGFGNTSVQKVYKVGGGANNFGKFGNLPKSIEELRKEYQSEAFNNLITTLSNFKFIKASQWVVQGGKQLSNVQIDSNGDVDIVANYSVSNNPNSTVNMSSNKFDYTWENEQTASDFDYQNFYYFVEAPENGTALTSLQVNNARVNDILNGNYMAVQHVNMRLSQGFNVADIKTWTLLDYIIVREFARGTFDQGEHKAEFIDLSEADNFQNAYEFGTDNKEYFVRLNGFYYNITKACTLSGSMLINDESTRGQFDTSELKVADLIGEYSFDFKVLVNEYSYVLSTSREEISRELIKTDKTLSFTTTIGKDESEQSYTYFREVDNNIDSGDVYRVIFANLSTYTISPMVKKVNWVQKLMNDMQVLYPDLNWANLIANDGWLDTLGEYYSAYASGEYLGSGNSANVTASGLVLSEFLLSIAKTSYLGYADYEYASIFDDEVIRALMYSLMGEENYKNLVLEAQVFVDMFNTSFAQVMDDIAYERNIDIVDGKVDNLQMSIYKAYLATMLLSSDLGEYLYVVATRIYAQYTIYESLAYAGQDYSSYYSYINGYTDENGETVTAFKYGTFQELVQFENENLRAGAVPTFTFNYADVYRSLVNPEATDDEVSMSLYSNDSGIFISYLKNYLKKFVGDGTFNTVEEIISRMGLSAITNITDSVFNGAFLVLAQIFNIPIPKTFNEVVAELNKSYDEKYLAGRGTTAQFSAHDSTRYSYLFHVYWSIRQNLYNRKLSTPVYLNLYKDYIDNDLGRWQLDSMESINGAANSIQYYNRYKAELQIAKIKFMARYPGMYVSNVIFGEIQDSQTVEEYVDYLDASREGDSTADIKSTSYRLDLIFQNNEVYHKMYEDVFMFSYFSHPAILAAFLNFTSSEQGNTVAWNKLVKMRDEMQMLLSELSEVMALSPGQVTENGTRYANFSQEVYADVYSKLNSLYEALNSYVSTQQTLDSIEKASISFTLAQYSLNYVEDGFDFTIQNKQYSLKSTVSAQRLAEYVYGGQFLSQFGVYAEYTSPDFEGIVKTSKAYDEKDDFVKTKLNIFPLLRQFASRIADYTAKVYFLTNLNDTSENVSDSLLLTDNIYASDSYLNTFIGREGATFKTSLEYLIVDHIIAQEELSADTLIRLIFADSVDSLQRLNCTDDYIILLAKYLEGVPMTPEEATRNSQNVVVGEGNTIADLSEEFKIIALRRYMAYVQTTSSNVKVLSNDGNIELSGNDINGYYGLYTENGYNSNGALSNGYDTASERVHTVFVNIISYLTVSEEQREDNDDLGSQGEHINYDTMTFQDLKAFLMRSLATYEKNEQETGAENSSRYLTLFNLVSGEFDYTLDGSGKFVGRTISIINKYTDEALDRVLYNDIEHQRTYDLCATFTVDRSTRGTILKLCGIENRPIEELVNLKYDEFYTREGNYDEAKGDVFIVCSYDELLGKYIPFMATNRKYSGTFGGTRYMDYLNDYGHNIYTDYYESPTGTSTAYPIIAKGILTADLMPTAIRTVNNEVEFYRTDITATGEVNENALNRVSAAGETSTVGYVKYVSYTSFASGGAQGRHDSQTSFIGSSDITTYVNSNAEVYYMQYTNIYGIGKIDEYDGISVLDEFSAFFKMSFQMHFMMILGFITLIPLLFKASGAVLRRVLDLILLVLIGPVCISMNALSYNDQENQAYQSWKKYLMETLLSVLGLIICFNLYYIMISTTMNMTFVTEGDATMQKISMIGGLSFVTARLLNGFIKFIFIIVATNMIQTAADMLANMITGGKVTKSFGSPLANGENAIDSIVSLKNQMVGDLNKALTTVSDVVSGKILIEAKNALIESLPGSNIVSGVKDTIGSIKNFQKSRELYKKARAKGISPLAAMTFAREYRNNYKKQQKQKRDHRRQYAQGFYSKMGMKAGY